MIAVALTLLCLLANERPNPLESGTVYRIALEISSENIERLRRNPRDNVPARIQVNDTASTEALVRLKGRGTFQPIDQKPSFTLIPSTPAEPLNLSRFHLNNSAEDPTYLKEALGRHVFRSAGLPAPSVCHAVVTLNGRALGLYVLKEGFTKEFLERSFGEASGVLYEPIEGRPFSEMEIDSGDVTDARNHLASLITAAGERNHQERLRKISALLDLEMFLKFIALEVIISHWDGYSLSENNYRLYFGGTPKRFRFIPTGMDQIFASSDYPWNPSIAGSIARSLLETEQGRTRYAEEFKTLLEENFKPDQLSARIEKGRQALRPHLKRAAYIKFLEETELLKKQIYNRAANLRAQMEDAPKLSFLNGEAHLTAWTAHDTPQDGALIQDKDALHIAAGSKTSASWQASVLLEAGTYRSTAIVSTHGVVRLPFGTRHGASLRVLGFEASSPSILGSANKPLLCEFKLAVPQRVTIVCELRASAGTVEFKLPVTLKRL